LKEQKIENEQLQKQIVSSASELAAKESTIKSMSSELESVKKLNSELMSNLEKALNAS